MFGLPPELARLVSAVGRATEGRPRVLLGRCIESDDVTNLDPAGSRDSAYASASSREARVFDSTTPAETYDFDLPAVPVRDPHKSRHSQKIAGPELASADRVSAKAFANSRVRFSVVPNDEERSCHT